MRGRGYYFDKLCTIYSSWYIKVDGSQKLVKTAVKTLIPCCFWSTSSQDNYENTWIAKQTDIEKFYVVLYPENTWIRWGMQIDIFEPIDWVNVAFWSYIIEKNPEINRQFNGVIDNIQLQLIARP